MRSSTTSQSSVFDFKNYLEERRLLVEKKLDEFLAIDEPEILWESMRYSALGAGKRIRALLAIATFESITRINKNDSGLKSDATTGATSKINALSQDELEKFLAPVLPLACAIEMVHAMSLVHDDLPCLDNDDMRRGKATNHKAYGEAMALLAGDALLMRAVEILICSRDIHSHIENKEILLDITGALAKATGANGMVGGQVFDLVYTGSGNNIDVRTGASGSDAKPQLDETVIRKIHAGKTGALLRFSLWSGARLANADAEQLAALEQFGDIVGLAFQITDDLLDVTGDVETLGKTPGKDQAANKATWVSVFGVDGAREKLHKLEDEGKKLLQAKGLSHADSPVLESLLEMAIHRRK